MLSSSYFNNFAVALLAPQRGSPFDAIKRSRLYLFGVPKQFPCPFVKRNLFPLMGTASKRFCHFQNDKLFANIIVLGRFAERGILFPKQPIQETHFMTLSLCHRKVIGDEFAPAKRAKVGVAVMGKHATWKLFLKCLAISGGVPFSAGASYLAPLVITRFRGGRDDSFHPSPDGRGLVRLRSWLSVLFGKTKQNALKKVHFPIPLAVLFLNYYHELTAALLAIVGISESGNFGVNSDQFKPFSISGFIPLLGRDFMPVMVALWIWFLNYLLYFASVLGILRFVALSEQLTENAHNFPLLNTFNLHCSEHLKTRQWGIL